MDEANPITRPGLDTDVRGPAEQYRLTVRGHLGAQAVEWFEGLTVTNGPGEIAEIAGPLIDQAALYALLTHIQSLGLPLLAVNRGPPTPLPAARHTEPE